MRTWIAVGIIAILAVSMVSAWTCENGNGERKMPPGLLNKLPNWLKWLGNHGCEPDYGINPPPEYPYVVETPQNGPVDFASD